MPTYEEKVSTAADCVEEIELFVYDFKLRGIDCHMVFKVLAVESESISPLDIEIELQKRDKLRERLIMLQKPRIHEGI